MKQPWTETKENLFTTYQTDAHGLSGGEAQKRLAQYGENKLIEGKQKSVLRVFAEQFADLLVVILLIAAIISALTGGWEGTIVIIAVLILNAILGTVQHFKAQKSLESLKAMSAPHARVLRDGEKLEISALSLVPGDILLLEAGDIAAADGRILENYSLQVNESALTGESENINKTDRPLDAEEPALGRPPEYGLQRFPCCLRACGGACNGNRHGYGNGENRASDGIRAGEGNAPAEKSGRFFQKAFDSDSDYLRDCVCAWRMAADGAWAGFDVCGCTGQLAAIPEALSSIVTIGLAIGTQKMAKQNAIIKKLRAVEALGSVSVICSDKTGTLTQNKMTVQKAFTLGRVWDAEEQPQSPLKELIGESVLCNDGAIHEEAQIGDPTETALLAFCRKAGGDENEMRQSFPRLQELPFDSDRKLMSTLHEIAGKTTLLTKGAPDVLLGRCSSAKAETGVVPMEDALVKQIHAQIAAFSAEGLRVLAFAEKTLPENRPLTLEDENDLTFIGLIAMMDPPREESAAAVADCRRAGIRPVMITGDHKVTASAIAKKIGILQEGDLAVEGAELERMTDEELKEKVRQISVYARVSPEHKIRIVRAWQENGCITAMTGDGVNDAPALKQADIGIAMGITGTEVSKDAAAMILTDDNFATIVKAVANGRNVYTNIKNSIGFLLSGNLAGILVVMFTSLMGLPLPFTAVQLLFINLLTDSLPALAVNMEQPTGDLLNQAPRKANEGILTGAFLKRLSLQGVLIAIVTMLAFYNGLAVSGAMACTMAFATLCLARLFHGFNCRGTRSVFRLPMNPFCFGAFAIGALLLFAVLCIPALHGLFDISNALTGNDILKIAGFAFLPTLLIQLFRVVRGK